MADPTWDDDDGRLWVHPAALSRTRRRYMSPAEIRDFTAVYRLPHAERLAAAAEWRRLRDQLHATPTRPERAEAINKRYEQRPIVGVN